MTLGERVKTVRQNAGLSQLEFAQSVSASRDMIANIEADRVTNLATKKPLLQLICDEYNVNSDWLIYGVETSTVSSRVRKLRKFYKLSTAKFAESLGVTHGVISNIELERITQWDTKMPLLNLMCEKYNCRREWLINGTGEMLKQESQADEMCRLVKKLYSSKAPSLKKDIITAVLQTPDKNFDVLEDMMQQILKGVASRMLKP